MRKKWRVMRVWLGPDGPQAERWTRTFWGAKRAALSLSEHGEYQVRIVAPDGRLLAVDR
jgi:hypothetical protein